MLEMRRRILEVIPTASEMMKYGMPTFLVDGTPIVGLLANKNHIGFYPYSGSVLSRFPEITDRYSHTKAALHIPIGEPLPRKYVSQLIKAKISDSPAVRGESKAEDSEYWKALGIPAPARRALVGARIASLAQLAKKKREDVAVLHGMGPKALTLLDRALEQSGKSWL
jgi:uncharacterized protein YdhG (YjbR/CyaY superfamily)